jgi:hypothetical protein
MKYEKLTLSTKGRNMNILTITDIGKESIHSHLDLSI